MRTMYNARYFLNMFCAKWDLFFCAAVARSDESGGEIVQPVRPLTVSMRADALSAEAVL